MTLGWTSSFETLEVFFPFFASLFRDFSFPGRGQGTINRRDKALGLQTELCSCHFMALITSTPPFPSPPHLESGCSRIA